MSSKAIKYFLHRLGTLKLHLTAMCVFSLLSYPYLCTEMIVFNNAKTELDKYVRGGGAQYNAAYNVYQRASGNLRFSQIIAVMAAVMLFLTGFFIVRRCFSYTFKKGMVDMEISLPISFKEKFIGDFSAGIAVYMLPHIICVLIGMAILKGDVIKYWSEQDYGVVIRTCMGVGTAMCLVFYCTTVVIFSVCGKTRETILSVFVFNICVPVLVYLGEALSVREAEGITYGINAGEVTPILSSLSALDIFIAFAAGNHERFMTFSRTAIIIVYCVLLMFAAYFLLKHRKHEMTGRPFVYKNVRHIWAAVLLLSVTVTLYSVLSDRNISTYRYGIPIFIIWLLSGAGLFIAAELLGGGNRKKLPLITANWAVGAVISAAVSLLLPLTHGLGAEGFVPSSGSAEVLLSSYNGNLYVSGAKTDDIQKISDVHREIIKTSADRKTDMFTLELKYDLSDGRTVRRVYRGLDSDMFRQVYNAMYESGSIKNMYDILRETIERPEEVYVSAESMTYGSGAGIPTEELQAALYEDAEKLTFERMYLTPHDNYTSLAMLTPEGGYIIRNRPKIYGFFDKTLAVLKKYGIELYESYTLDEAYIMRLPLNAERPYSMPLMLQSRVYYGKEDVQYNGEYAKISDTGLKDELLGFSAPETYYSDSEYGYYIVCGVSYRDYGGTVRERVCCIPIAENFAQRAEEIFGQSERVERETVERFVKATG